MESFKAMAESAVASVLQPSLDGLANLVFFSLINDFLRDEIDEFQANLLGRFMELIGVAAFSVLTLWIFIQGFRILTGRSRESLMGLVTDSLRAILIVGLATGLAAGGSTVYRTLTEGLGTAIYGTVTSEESNIDAMYSKMDQSLVIMNVAMAKLDAVQTAGDEKLEGEVSRARWMAGLGTAGPALTAGVMLTLNKIAIALFTGLGPLFILCLLFEQTKPLFQRWLLYGIGTMFSLAVLYVMVILATDAVVAVAGAFWVTDLLALSTNEGLKTIALQQGGLGLILTMLLISAPPMAATFFQGTLGSFMAYNQFANTAGTGAAAAPGAYGPGSPPNVPRNLPNGGAGADEYRQAPQNLTRSLSQEQRLADSGDVVRAGRSNANEQR